MHKERALGVANHVRRNAPLRVGLFHQPGAVHARGHFVFQQEKTVRRDQPGQNGGQRLPERVKGPALMQRENGALQQLVIQMR